ncbi:shikimate dehydrogenase [Micromonospora sp. WMMD980]|uniref:shikimate dehydrogenase family protein n=1 Tax=Micromonospora sp. WMMD980 TaxID=3016088 RepID=UPI0024169FCE|nr:shikimate dehydrogenase [Micromonospora sp. WMMD980]MDG4800213.1 shikimate dehydrogenase [Micromonospora sp. WMMD980]
MTTPGRRAPAITGATRLYAVLGDPVTQVKAPGMLNAMFDAHGHPGVLVPVHVDAAGLPAVMAGLRAIRNLDGILVTVPHKADVLRFADHLSATVEVSGTANALRREPDGTWSADNFDGSGFVAGLRAAGHRVSGRTVSIVGAGGAGSAIAVAVLDAGAARVWVSDVDPVRLDRLLRRLDGGWPGRTAGSPAPRLADADVAVNATPLGMRATDPLPLDPSALRAGTVVVDIVMQPPETALLRAARTRGHPVQPGLPMLRHQLDSYRRFFRIGAGPAAEM